MPKKPKGGRRNISWEKIKADYVSDPGLSLKKIAEKYGVPLRTVAEHSKADNWFATKQEHQRQYCNELASKLHRKKLDSLEQELDAVQNMSDRIAKMLSQDPNQFNRHLVETKLIDDDGGMMITTIEKQFDKLDVRAMKDTMSVLKSIEDLKRSILSIATADMAHKHRMDMERMQLERERFEFEKEKAEFHKPDTSAVIRIEGFEEGWDE